MNDSAVSLLPDGALGAKGGHAVPRFYWKEKTTVDGKTIREPWVEISIPGSKLSVVHLKVTEQHKLEYPAYWAMFERGEEGIVGTPIDQLPGLDQRQVMELMALNIPTIEILAGLPDAGLQRIGMGARALQAQAQAHLRARQAETGTELLLKKMEQMQRQIEELQASATEPKKGRKE